MFKILFNKYKMLKNNKEQVKVGKNTRVLTSWANFGSEPHLVEIGNNCTITSGVRFITHDASLDVVFNYLEKSRTIGNFKYEKLGKILIKDNCMIGVNTIILPNVEIGPNSIVGAGSVVTKKILPNSVYAGNPAKRICSLDEYCKKIDEKIKLIEK